MKKTIIFATLALLALAVSSCKKDDPDAITFRVTTEDLDGDSKVYIDDTRHSCWQNGDKIKVYSYRNGVTKSATATVEVDGSRYLATVTGLDMGEGTQYMAYFPADKAKSFSMLNGKPTISVEMPSSVSYTGNGVAPLCAYTDDNNLEFKNVCGILRVKLTATNGTNVPAILVRGAGLYNGASSTPTVSMTGGVPTLNMPTAGVAVFTYSSFPSGRAPVPGTFDIPLPAGSRVDAIGFAPRPIWCEATTSIRIQRNKIYTVTVPESVFR